MPTSGSGFFRQLNGPLVRVAGRERIAEIETLSPFCAPCAPLVFSWLVYQGLLWRTMKKPCAPLCAMCATWSVTWATPLRRGGPEDRPQTALCANWGPGAPQKSLCAPPKTQENKPRNAKWRTRRTKRGDSISLSARLRMHVHAHREQREPGRGRVQPINEFWLSQ